MDEALWLITHSRPLDMFRYVRASISVRKMQLVSCAACRLIWEHLRHSSQRQVVEMVEQFADGLLPDDAFAEATRLALSQVTMEMMQSLPGSEPGQAETLAMEVRPPATPVMAAALALQAIVGTPADDGLRRVFDWVLICATRASPQGQRGATREKIESQFCEILREIVGNPFRERTVVPVWMPSDAVEYPSWLTKVTETARIIAEGVRIDQAYDRLPILADALEEAGCTDQELLLHLRRTEIQHLRGCWALDLILGAS